MRTSQSHRWLNSACVAGMGNSLPGDASMLATRYLQNRHCLSTTARAATGGFDALLPSPPARAITSLYILGFITLNFTPGVSVHTGNREASGNMVLRHDRIAPNPTSETRCADDAGELPAAHAIGHSSICRGTGGHRPSRAIDTEFDERLDKEVDGAGTRTAVLDHSELVFP